ncbi:hypothetical protein KA005_07325 [bacterium]|nr:hypothetical protein [bacterium]
MMSDKKIKLRLHIHESAMQRAVKQAIRNPVINKRAIGDLICQKNYF